MADEVRGSRLRRAVTMTGAAAGVAARTAGGRALAPQNDNPNAGYCYNPYPGPEDGLNSQPFDGSYPKIKPCNVPPRSRPTDPCE